MDERRMRHDAISDRLNDLARAASDAGAQFRAAAAALADDALRALLGECAHAAETAADDLQFLVDELHGDSSGGTAASVQRAPDISRDRAPADPSAPDDDALLAACEATATTLLAQYVAALESPAPEAVHGVVRSQLDAIQRDRDRLRALRAPECRAPASR